MAAFVLSAICAKVHSHSKQISRRKGLRIGGCQLGACQDLDGNMLNMKVDENWKLAEEICHGIDYLKAEYLIIQEHNFAPKRIRHPFQLESLLF